VTHIADIDLDSIARPAPAGYDDQLLIVADRIPTNLEQYRGGHVVIAIDNSGALIGVTDGFDTWRKLDKVSAPLESMDGRLQDFQVRGTGECGAQGQRCCMGPGDECVGLLQCRSEVCEVPACTVPGATCEGDVAVMCTEDLTEERENCAALDQLCESGTCVPPTCEAGELRCNKKGTQFRACRNRGRGWSDLQKCPSGHLCKARDECRPIGAALVEFREIKLSKKWAKQYRASRFDLQCQVQGALTSSLVTVPLAPGPIGSPKQQPTLVLLYGDSSHAIKVRCRVLLTQTTNTPKPRQTPHTVKPPEIRPIKKDPALGAWPTVKRHPWNHNIERKQHRFPVGFSRSRRLDVIYSIELLMRGDPRIQSGQNNMTRSRKNGRGSGQ